MSFFNKRKVTGCPKCHRMDFEYNDYYSKYKCEHCGWTVKERPNGDIKISKIFITKRYSTDVSNTENAQLSITSKQESLEKNSKDFITIPHFKTKLPITVPKLAVSDCQQWQIEVLLSLIRKSPELSEGERVMYQMNIIEKRLKDKYDLDIVQCCSVYAFVLMP